VGRPADHARFADRCADEIHAVGQLAGTPRLATVFCGGGTPSVLGGNTWRRIGRALHEAFNLDDLGEFTVEANPESVCPPLLEALAAIGVNRLSLGVQSFSRRHLATLDRQHTPDAAIRALNLTRRTGPANLSIDLIFAIPGQTVDDWRDDLRRAIDLGPGHVSCYGLTFESGTPLTLARQTGRIQPIDQRQEAVMYEAAIDTLTAAGYEHYEISNFAQPGRRCEHNLLYWRNENWLAIGPAASGHCNGLRWTHTTDLSAYLDSTGLAPVEQVEQLEKHESIGEQLMMRLRLLEGIDVNWLDEHLDTPRVNTIEQFQRDGLLWRANGRVGLTRRGLMIADSLIARLL
jgi:oxygen-independent coproporphyrinogen-3 oxidase